MIFRRTYSSSSKLSAGEIKEKLEGKKFKVHDLDFEVMSKNGVLKVIPLTELSEDKDKIYTLPITRIVVQPNGAMHKVKMKFKARRIDSGGPKLLVFFILFLFVAALLLWIFLGPEYHIASVALAGGGLLFLFGFMYKMNTGYYDYIRKIRAWVTSQI